MNKRNITILFSLGMVLLASGCCFFIFEQNKVIKDLGKKVRFHEQKQVATYNIGSPPTELVDSRILLEQEPLSRIYNPLRGPLQSQPRFDLGLVTAQQRGLPAEVIGCGGRNQPCLGGVQEVIPNMMPPLNIANTNIAPINVRTRGPEGVYQQVGVIQKIFGNENEMHPLYGRKKYPNGNRWEYYTMVGPYGLKLPVLGNRNHEELGTNDRVKVRGKKDEYQVITYDFDEPQYIPYV